MTRLPLTVIGGYLGAGKTTLINQMLTGDHGKRLMVMVNDFGAVNIDAALLASASEDTLELTNGCVCCTLGADLFLAIGDVLDRPTRPDHLIIEASGIADPAKIAEVARAEPDLSYAGILTVIDGQNYLDLQKDQQIAPQLRTQAQVADLIYISKAPGSAALLAELGRARVVHDSAQILPLLFDFEGPIPATEGTHAHFVKWEWSGQAHLDRTVLAAKLRERPSGLYRLKGFVGGFTVQVVGKSVEILPGAPDGPDQLVGIGPVGQVTREDITNWWEAHGLDPDQAAK